MYYVVVKKFAINLLYVQLQVIFFSGVLLRISLCIRYTTVSLDVATQESIYSAWDSLYLFNIKMFIFFQLQKICKLLCLQLLLLPPLVCSEIPIRNNIDLSILSSVCLYRQSHFLAICRWAVVWKASSNILFNSLILSSVISNLMFNPSILLLFSGIMIFINFYLVCFKVTCFLIFFMFVSHNVLNFRFLFLILFLPLFQIFFFVISLRNYSCLQSLGSCIFSVLYSNSPLRILNFFMWLILLLRDYFWQGVLSYFEVWRVLVCFHSE